VRSGAACVKYNTTAWSDRAVSADLAG